MKRSIATVSLSGTLPEKLEAAAAAGFDGIELFENDLLYHSGSPQDIRRRCEDLGLEITLFQPFRDFEGLPEPYRARAFARAARKFELMNQLGTDLMLVCSSTHPAAMGGIDRMAQDFRDLGDLAARYNVRVGFEALCWGRFVNDHRDAWEVVRRADHPNVGLILDSFHTLARRIDPDTIRAIPGDRIFFVQLADAPAATYDGRIAGLPAGTLQRPLADFRGNAALQEALATRRLLLVLDNAERLVEPAAWLVENLLQGCPQLRVLVTSREALRVEGEADEARVRAAIERAGYGVA